MVTPWRHHGHAIVTPRMHQIMEMHHGASMVRPWFASIASPWCLHCASSGPMVRSRCHHGASMVFIWRLHGASSGSMMGP